MYASCAYAGTGILSCALWENLVSLPGLEERKKVKPLGLVMSLLSPGFWAAVLVAV